MRKREYIPSSVLALVTILWIFSATYLPEPLQPSYSPLALEMIGSFVGFALALSFAEIFRLANKRDREIELTDLLIEEMKEFLVKTPNIGVPILIQIDMWEMGISSGDLKLFSNEKMRDFRDFYYRVKHYSGLMDVVKGIPQSDQETILQYEKMLVSQLKDIKACAKAHIEKYGST